MPDNDEYDYTRLHYHFLDKYDDDRPVTCHHDSAAAHNDDAPWQRICTHDHALTTPGGGSTSGRRIDGD